MRLLAIPAIAIVLLAAPPAGAIATGLDVDIAAPDGFTLRGTYWAASGPGPGVLLLHQCNRDRRSWDDAARALAEAGLHVLTLDFRGFGESMGEGVGSFRQHGDDLWPLWEGDVDRALAFLTSLPDVDGARLGAMGASCGGSQALLLATRDPSVVSLVFLSSSLPWISEEDVAVFHRNRDVPLLGIAAEQDRASADQARALFTSSRHPATRLLLYKGEQHGVPLFDQDPALIGTIVDFFGRTLSAAE